MSRPLFLTGMMGAGKSTVGRELARRAAIPFIDLDARVERLFGETVEQLFSRGEPHFRAREREALVALVAEPAFSARPVVIATGGGIVIDPRNLAMMNQVGVTVFLDVPTQELASRLREGSARPLLPRAEEELQRRLQQLLEERRASYEACTVRVDGSGSVGMVVERTLQALEGVASD